MAGVADNAAAMVVDGQYFYIMQRDNELDVMKVLDFIQGETGLEIQDRFWLDRQLTDQRKNFLRSADGPRFSVKEYPSKEKECPICHGRFPVQAGCDVGIALRIFRLCQTFKRIILLAGDGDFEEALEYARDYAHCEIILISFKSNSSPKLHPYARRVIFLDVNDGRLKLPRMRADGAAEPPNPAPWPPPGDTRPDTFHKPRLLFDPGPVRPLRFNFNSSTQEVTVDPRHRTSPDGEPSAAARSSPSDAEPASKAEKPRRTSPAPPTAGEEAKPAKPEKARGKQLKAGWWAYPVGGGEAEERPKRWVYPVDSPPLTEERPKKDDGGGPPTPVPTADQGAGRQSKRKANGSSPVESRPL
eukprot:EG_transcript_17603